MNTNIHEIIIEMRTNISGNSTMELTSDVLYIGNDDNRKYNKYPFFTDHYRYPGSLAQKNSKQLKRIFFDSNTFVQEIQGNKTNNPKERQANALHNMKVFMELIMPTSFPIENNYHISYDENIKGSFANFQQTKSWVSYLLGPKQKFSYIQRNNQIYSFIEVTWINDIINNKQYRSFFQMLYKFKKWKEVEIEKRNKENETILKNLMELYNQFADSFFKINGGFSNQEHVKMAINKRQERNLSPKIILPDLNELKRVNQLENDSNKYKNMLEIFFKLRKTEMQANVVNTTAYFFPQELTSLPNFRKLLNDAQKYYFNKAFIEYLDDLPKYNALNIIDSKDLGTEWEKYMQREMKKVQEFSQLFNEVRKYRKPETPEEKAKGMDYQIVTNASLQELINNLGRSGKSKELFDLSTFVFYILTNTPKDKIDVNVNPALLELGLIIEKPKQEGSEKEKGGEDIDIFGLKTKSRYKASFQVAFVKGMLNKSMEKIIKCIYRNNDLIRMFDTMQNPRKNNYLVYSNYPLIDVDAMAKEEEQKKNTRKKDADKKNIAQATRRQKVGGFKPNNRTNKNR
jgi:hypothetical protein